MAAENPSHIKMINILTKSFELSNMKPFGLIHIVDDDEQIRSVIGMILVRTGYTVATYESPHAYLAQSHEPQREVMLLDIRMPGMSGIELHAHLIEQGQLMPTIFMSGEYLPHELAAIEAAGCVEFLNKPFGMNPLLSAVEKAFALISP
jgi:FixJ family two-component response regulator